ncbi:MAG: hypothetical protein QOI29_4814, partial [Mycobacterium sp.]|nr:hypothetical protein [Mycobacterium sp.]
RMKMIVWSHFGSRGPGGSAVEAI